MHIKSFDLLPVDDSLWSILLRFFFNLLVLFIIIRVIYYKYSKREEYLFSFFIMGNMIFLMVSILETLEIHMGIALGLFAVFSILRFRTVGYSVKEMSYIFTIIGVSLINSQARIAPHVIGALLINSLIILILFALEIYLDKKSYASFLITYRNIKLLTPEFRKELLTDLSLHTGQKIEKIKIRTMDIGKENAEIEVFFKDIIVK
jgi:hypothetical protein